MLVDDKVIVEIKASEFMTPIYKAQLLNYLRTSGYSVGLLLNFGKPRLEYKRVVV